VQWMSQADATPGRPHGLPVVLHPYRRSTLGGCSRDSGGMWDAGSRFGVAPRLLQRSRRARRSSPFAAGHSRSTVGVSSPRSRLTVPPSGVRAAPYGR
jgi:hypothetical protein